MSNNKQKLLKIAKQVESSTKYESLYNFKFHIFPKTAIDQDFLQRLLKVWSPKKSANYLSGFYTGYRDIDPFVLVKLDAILVVLNQYKESLEEDNTSDRAVMDTFIDKIKGFQDQGKEYLMINGQHRKRLYQDFWNDEITLDEDFPTIGKHTDVEGFSWTSFDEQEQLSLLAVQHLVVIVDKFKTMSNLKDIVIFHNTGNEWNPHEERIITPSYIASQLYDLNEDPDFRVIFSKVKSDDKYSYYKKGIAFFLTQMYWSWAKSTTSNPKTGKPEWYQLPTLADKRLDSLVEMESQLWTVGKVNKFKSLAKKIARGYSSYVKNLKTMKDARGLTFKIATFRNYFLLRVAMDVKGHHALDTRYTVTNESDFMTKWVIQESKRMGTRKNLTNEGKAKWDAQDKNGLGLDDKTISKLKKNYIDPNSYIWRLRGGGSGESLSKVVGEQVSDFLNEFSAFESSGVVNRQGADLNSIVTNEVLLEAMGSKSLETASMEELLTLQDGGKTHIGHKKAKSKGGEPTLGNLEPQDQFYNQSQGNK